MYRCIHCGTLETLDLEEPYKRPCYACNQLELLNVQISDTKNLLDDLLVQRRQLKSKVNQFHNPMIHQTPIEITSYIFELYVSDEGPLSADSTVTDSDTSSQLVWVPCPLTLGAICQTWRRIAWSTPRVWTHIGVVLDSKTCATDLQFATDFIDRSGQLPLSISLSMKLGMHSVEPESIFYPFIEVVNQCSNRWKSLNLELPSYLLEHIRSGSSQGAPILEEIRLINTTPYQTGKPESRKFSLGAVKPSPKSVDFADMALTYLDMEWNHVVQVCASGFFVDEALELFRCSPQMEGCTLQKIKTRFTADVFPISGPFQHPKLNSLPVFIDFSCRDGEADILLFFSNVAFPALRSFSCNTRQRDLHIDTMSSFFKRSSCHLEGMVLEETAFTDESLIQLLRTMPSLKQIFLLPAIRNPPILLDLFFHALGSKTAASDDFLPSLESLRVIGTKLDWEPILEFCLSVDLKPNGFLRPLDNIRVQNLRMPGEPAPSINPERLSRLLELIDQGLKISICYEYETGLVDMIHKSAQ